MSASSQRFEVEQDAGVNGLPLVHEVTPVPDVFQCLCAMTPCRGVCLLESAQQPTPQGRYSFLTADPFRVWSLQEVVHGADPFGPIRGALARLTSRTVPELPPFQGGAAGVLSYELGGCWERIPRATFDEFRLPDLTVGLYDWTLTWDHLQGRCWIIAQGFPHTRPDQRADHAARRLEWVLARLAGDRLPAFHATSESDVPHQGRLARTRAAPRFPVPSLSGLESDFSREGYLRMVERVIAYICAGDVFQANVSQRLLCPLEGTELELYARLRERNPAPFAGYFAMDDWAVLSASPEQFLSVRGGVVTTRPIKGTRRRRPGPEADLFTRDELRQSEKDRAENVMIVDLLRNDLSRACQPGSIRVSELCRVEMYETVQHLVSTVSGRLMPQMDPWNLLQAVFPGGSITGAPKVRAMQIIAEQEPTARGPYCGSLFYLGFDGQMDSNILIRTFICRDGWVQLPAGGGIVAQSDPAAEYNETLSKAEGMLRAIRT